MYGPVVSAQLHLSNSRLKQVLSGLTIDHWSAIESMFEMLMEATKYCSLGQLTAAMSEVGDCTE